MFKLRSPCATCPFRKGQGSFFGLHVERLGGIMNATGFQCHKTVDYVETDDEEGIVADPGEHPQQCAGLMAVLHRIGQPNSMMQCAGRLGFETFDPAKLDPRGEAYDDWLQVLDAHLTGKEPTP